MITSRISRLPHHRALLAVADLASMGGALLFAVALRFGWSAGLLYLEGRALSLCVAGMIFPVTFYVGGLYDTKRLHSSVYLLFSAARSIGVGVLLAGAYLYATSSELVGRGVVVAFTLALVGAMALSRVAFVNAARRGILSARCIVIGTGAQALSVVNLVRRHPDAGLTIVGLVGRRGARPLDGALRHDESEELPVVGDVDSLDELVQRLEIDRVIVATTLEQEPVLLRRLRPLRYRGVGLSDVVSLYEELRGEVPVDRIDDRWLLAAAMTNSRLHIRRLKRVCDVVGSLVLLVPMGIVIAIATLAIRLNSRGPVFYRQERLGLGSKPFMLLKLRTMFEDAETLTGPVWSTDNDPRVTAVGRILRKFRIDEFPQLVNVLRGDMSLVGPRPERPVFVKNLSETLPFYSERMLVRPGITGWAQVMAPYAASVSDSLRKLQYDLYYTKHVSFSLDLLIVLKTAKTVLFGRERDQGGMRAGHQLEVVPEPTPLAKAAERG